MTDLMCSDIITRDEIMEIIDTYNVSQKFLSKMLGWGEITLSRYINGGSTPNKINSDRLKTLRNPYVYLSELENAEKRQGKNLQNEVSYRKSQKSINAILDKLERDKGKIFSVANWFMSQSADDNPITHSALQKLLYFTQGWSIVILGKWIFQDECQVRAYGAVYDAVYDMFGNFENNPLPGIDKTINLDDREKELVQFIKQYYGDIYTAKTLEKICYYEEPYRIARSVCNENDLSFNAIRKDDMKAYYFDISDRFHISYSSMNGVRNYLYYLLN